MLCTVIYVDVLIFINIIINYFILSAVKKFLHKKTKNIRLIISSVVGAGCSLAVFLPMFDTPLSMIVKLLVAVIITGIGFSHSGIREFVRTTVCTFVFSVIFCGFMILFYEVAKPSNMAIVNDIVYFDINPVVLIGITVVIYTLVLAITRIVCKEDMDTRVDLKIKINNVEYQCTGKIDTGNSVVEPFSGAPVIIAEKSVINNNIHTTRLVPYKTLGNEGLLNAVKADDVEINNKKIDKEIYIAIFIGEIDKEIKAIINSQILG